MIKKNGIDLVLRSHNLLDQSSISVSSDCLGLVVYKKRNQKLTDFSQDSG
jgi:hypothetical protein